MHSKTLLFTLATSIGLLSRAQAAHHLVSGSSVSSQTDVPLRRNINDLEKEAGPQWDLYIQALKAMQEVDPKDELSYFKIAGIHGKPYIEWDSAGPRSGDGWLGYCPHGELLFLPWHRPYILLFEQMLVKHAGEIAAKYPSNVRDKYVEAARNLRSPYWDWATDNAVPPSTVPTTITINVAGDGKTGIKSTQFDNPLRAYKMPQEALNGQWGEFDPAQRPETLRCPGNYPGAANENLRSRNLKNNLYYSFVYAQKFDHFSQTGSRGVGLEQIHNWIHVDAACDEQFSNLDLAAFDPLFMLHHTNVDRFWAYWQYMRPNQADFSHSYRGQSRYSTPQDTVITPESTLSPFFNTDSTMHTSQSVNKLQGLGYTYAGLVYWNMTSDELKRSATTIINTQYGGGDARDSSSSSRKSHHRSDSPGSKRRDNLDDNKAADDDHGDQMTNKLHMVRVEADRAEMKCPSTINVYAGNDIKAGGVVVMCHPATGKVKGSFAVDKIARKMLAETNNSNGTTILASLANSMTFAAHRRNGSRIPLSSITSFKAVVEEVPYTPPRTVEELPVLGEPKVHNVTIVERGGGKGQGRHGKGVSGQSHHGKDGSGRSHRGKDGQGN